MAALNNLALMYYASGQYSQAEPVAAKVVDFQRRVLGAEHPNSLTAEAQLAVLYRVQGRYAEAEPLLTSALATGRRVQGEQHPNTLLTMRKLADLYRHEGKYVQAESLYTSVVEGRRRALGDEHPDTLESRASLGRVRLLRREYAAAEATLREALQGYERGAPDTWQRYNCQSLLGASLAGQKKYAEAESPLLSGYDGMMQRRATIPVPDHVDLAEAGERIVKMNQDWGKLDKAAEWQQKLRASGRP
jgi:tetratricopeptide (TPR) repeat protein